LSRKFSLRLIGKKMSTRPTREIVDSALRTIVELNFDGLLDDHDVSIEITAFTRQNRFPSDYHVPPLQIASRSNQSSWPSSEESRDVSTLEKRAAENAMLAAELRRMVFESN